MGHLLAPTRRREIRKDRGVPVAVSDEKILIFDGACGTNIQAMDLPESAWAGQEGCNEVLNLSAPEAIFALHTSFLSAGATVLETNPFGANAVVLAEYGLADRAGEINRAAVRIARDAIAAQGGRGYIAGSIGGASPPAGGR